MKHLFFSVFLFFSINVQAKLFQNTYVSFEIPENWNCKSFGTDWVCHSKLKGRNVEALITSTAKIAGPNDNLEEYKTYLEEPKSWVNIKKEQIVSEKWIAPKKKFINKFPWVDSIHKNSEIKSYVSRYVATICCEEASSKLGILVVLSAHQNHYTKYSSDFVKVVNSLRVQNIEKAISKVRASELSHDSGMVDYMEGLFETVQDSKDNLDRGKIFGLSLFQIGTLVVLILMLLCYYIIKKGKRNKKRKPRNRRR